MRVIQWAQDPLVPSLPSTPPRKAGLTWAETRRILSRKEVGVCVGRLLA